MGIPDRRLEAFIDAYELGTGERLSREDALDAAMRVLAFVELLSKWPKRPAPRSDEPAASARSATDPPRDLR